MFEVTVESGGRQVAKEVFEAEICCIGTAPDNDMILPGAGAAPYHARIRWRNGRLCIEDLGGVAGTYVNGERIVRHEPLSLKDEIVIGTFQLRVDPGAGACRRGTSPANGHQGPTADAPGVGPFGGDDHDQLLEWRRRLHLLLIEEMDLRRKDIHQMDDDALRREAGAVLEELLAAEAGRLPEQIDRRRLHREVLAEAVGLGPIQPFIDDDQVSEIMVNSSSEIFIEKNGRLQATPCRFTSDQAVLAVIERIISPLGRRIDESSPMVDARLQDGSRVNAVIPPVAVKGPSITIRKFSCRRLQLDDLVRLGSLSPAMAEFLRICVEHHCNIVVSGGTGSGKTTLLNVLSNLIPDSERVVTVEDAAELKLNQPNLVALESRPPNMEGRGQVTIRQLVRNALRMRPDRIVVGECRDQEALDMLQAMNTGHSGSLTTAHANSPRDVLARLETMVMMAGMELPSRAIREQIAAAIQIIIHQARFSCGARKVTHISEVAGMESGVIQLQDIFRFRQNGFDAQGRVVGSFEACGVVPQFYERLAGQGCHMDCSLFQSPRETDR